MYASGERMAAWGGGGGGGILYECMCDLGGFTYCVFLARQVPFIAGVSAFIVASCVGVV